MSPGLKFGYCCLIFILMLFFKFWNFIDTSGIKFER